MAIKYFFLRKTALFLIFTLLFQTIFPVASYALTSGPDAPEFTSFTPVGTNDMVDLFTGDFHYNIPLMDVGGYPINIAYNAGPQMDDEASWVGLGWNLNVGTLTRDVRGLPDDFKSDSITKSFNIKEDITIGGAVGGGMELFGIPLGVGFGKAFLSGQVGLSKNSITGYALTTSVNPAIELNQASLGRFSAGLDISNSAQNGLSFDGNFSATLYGEESEDTPADTLPLKSPSTTSKQAQQSIEIVRHSAGIGVQGINSRTGLQTMTLSPSYYSAKMWTPNIRRGISFTKKSYIPTQNLPFASDAITFKGIIGGALFGINGNITINGFQNRQKLAFKKQKQAAYGYLFNQQANDADLMDVNRERHNLPWKSDMPVIPPSFGTYDLFSATGQGVSGQFHLVRNDIGSYKETDIINTNVSGSIGVEIGGLPNTVKGGVDVNAAFVKSTGSNWSSGNSLSQYARFTDWDSITTYEPSYFRKTDEITLTDIAFYNMAGGVNTLNSDLSKFGNEKYKFQLSNNQISQGEVEIDATLARKNREKRSTTMQYLTALEASVYGLETDILSYPKGTLRIGQSGCIQPQKFRRQAKPHNHISEVTIVQPDGSRYVYGVPVYNNRQKSVSFSIDSKNKNTESGVITYDEGDNSVNNTKGKHNFYDAEELPPYATSFLLTGVISPDYRDRTGDGITYDDMGSGVRVNYTKMEAPFKWRTPVGVKDPSTGNLVLTKTARFAAGRKCITTDDKASYVYGEKELWYVHSVESNGMVAQFYTSDREDGLGVSGENGDLDSHVRIQKLDSIQLYAASDLMKNGSNAIPIKTVHFEYNYQLCPGTVNSIAPDKGKLTLTKLWYTYGKCRKGALNAYQFNYQMANVKYDITHIDRWGAYRELPAGYPLPDDYPYSLQATGDASLNATINANAGVWCLNQIGLPTGGVINIDYESDTYAYVQHKRAGQMIPIAGFSTDEEAASQSIYTELYTSSQDPRNYIWVDLGPDSKVSTLEEARLRYLQDLRSLWFNIRTDLTGKGDWEDVKGYLTPNIKNERPLYGKFENGFVRFLAIPVKTARREGYRRNAPSLNRKMNPVTKAALQMLRLELPEKLYIGYENSTAVEAFLKSMPSLFQNISQMVYGFEEESMSHNRAKKVGVDNRASWLRLSNPDFNKYGGGHRVKRVSISDSWDSMSDQDPAVAASYGQEYDYTTTNTFQLNNETVTEPMSSGVASWEPSIGGEENLWKEPLTYRESIKLAPDNSYYVETPIMESLYPAPVVGYSKVKVKTLHGQNNRTSPGWTEYAFYTAKEFPVITDMSVPEKYSNSTGAKKIVNLFRIFARDYFTIAQGFKIELNDMHGKMKSENTYAQNGALVSFSKYEYHVDNENTPTLHLKNVVSTVARDGSISQNKQLGVDVEIWRDYIQERSQSRSMGVATNADGFFPGPFPIIFGLAKGLLVEADVRFRSVVTTKYIMRHGLISKVIKYQEGSRISTENLLYDEETGGVLATKTQNEYKDPIYTFTFPAYWAYDGMGMAAQNAGAWFEHIKFKDGVPLRHAPWETSATILSNYQQSFTEGDEVILMPSKTRWLVGNARVLTVYKVGNQSLKFYNSDGTPFEDLSNRYFVKIRRSGNRNHLGSTVASMVSKTDPMPFSNIHDWAKDAQNKVIDADASTYRDLWKMDCLNCLGEVQNTGTTINPYLWGVKGNWRVDKDYALNTLRNNGDLNTQTDIRTKGEVINFNTFWVKGSNGKMITNPDAKHWVVAMDSAAYDFKGNQIEERDALGIYSGAHFGYYHHLNKHVTHNAKFRESGSDNFEDYASNFNLHCESPLECDAKLRAYGMFSGGEISPIYTAHSGKYSYKVTPGNNAEKVFGFSIGDNYNILNTSNSTYIRGNDICLKKETLSPGKYVVSVWSKEIVTEGGNEGGGGSGMQVIFKDNNGNLFPNTLYYTPSGSTPIIEGWRRYYFVFDTPANLPEGSTVTIQLVANRNAVTYFDDFRVHPFLGNMKSFVYDPYSFRLMATLNENNYATFYQYDDEGSLIRLNQETERGVMTIQEYRKSFKPNNN